MIPSFSSDQENPVFLGFSVGNTHGYVIEQSSQQIVMTLYTYVIYIDLCIDVNNTNKIHLRMFQKFVLSKFLARF